MNTRHSKQRSQLFAEDDEVKQIEKELKEMREDRLVEEPRGDFLGENRYLLESFFFFFFLRRYG